MAMNEPTHGWGRKQMLNVLQAVLRAIGLVLGIFLVLIAIPFFFLPVPLGIPLAAFGLLLIAATSRTAHDAITGYLQRHPEIWKRVKHIFDRFKRDES